jgi:7-keto-8-aminopelargonate synthetase-like enzyme
MKTQTKYYFSANKDTFVHRGTEEYHNIIGEVDIINSTLGKAMGGASGGYTAGPKELIDLLRQRGRPYLFSNSLPPPVVAAGSKVSIAHNCFNISQD